MGRKGMSLRSRSRRIVSRVDRSEEMKGLRTYLSTVAGRGRCHTVCSAGPARFAPPVVVASFKDTGRGMMATRPIASGDVIIAIPMKAMVTVKSVHQSALAQSLSEAGVMLSNRLNDNPILMLAAYLMHEAWRPNSAQPEYLVTLPHDYSTPPYWSRSDYETFPEEIQKLATPLQASCAKDCAQLEDLWTDQRAALTKEKGGGWPNSWTVAEAAKWAWCSVNTRCVSLIPLGRESQQYKKSCKQHATIPALAPLLDMFNHFAEASMDAGYNATTDCYEIITNNSYNPGDEVFIKYGDYSSAELCLEYGFVPATITAHDLVDCAPFLHQWFGRLKITSSSERYCNRLDILARELPGCDEGCFVGRDGPSWALLVNLRLLAIPEELFCQLAPKPGAICCALSDPLDGIHEYNTWSLFKKMCQAILQELSNERSVSLTSTSYISRMAHELHERPSTIIKNAISMANTKLEHLPK